MVCKCPPDTVTDINGNCKAILKDQPACLQNNDCQNSHVCRNGNCILACKLESCGQNAQCNSENHAGICSCPHGYSGNPYIECTFVNQYQQPIYECTSDYNCADDQVCSNTKCTNPCKNRNSCGTGAFCYVQSMYLSAKFSFVDHNNFI